jgi:hypothetical protein
VSIKFCSVLLNRIIPINNKINVKTKLYNKRKGLNSPAPIRPYLNASMRGATGLIKTNIRYFSGTEEAG